MVQKREDRAQHAAETLEQRSEKAKGEGSCTAQTASERQTTSQWKSTWTWRWDPWGERYEEWKFSDMALWTRWWRCDGITFISTQDCHTYISSSIHSYLSFHCPRETRFNDTWRTPCSKKASDLRTLVIILSHFTYTWILPSPCTCCTKTLKQTSSKLHN